MKNFKTITILPEGGGEIGGCAQDSSGTGQGEVVGRCEHCN